MNYPTPHINATPDDFGQTVVIEMDEAHTMLLKIC